MGGPTRSRRRDDDVAHAGLEGRDRQEPEPECAEGGCMDDRPALEVGADAGIPQPAREVKAPGDRGLRALLSGSGGLHRTKRRLGSQPHRAGDPEPPLRVGEDPQAMAPEKLVKRLAAAFFRLPDPGPEIPDPCPQRTS